MPSPDHPSALYILFFFKYSAFKTWWFALTLGDGTITKEIASSSLDKLHIDANGLDYTDYRYLRAIVMNFKGGPVGVEAVAATISEEASTIEDVYEPFLLQEGYINRTPRGRVVTEKTYKLLKISFNEGLFGNEN